MTNIKELLKNRQCKNVGGRRVHKRQRKKPLYKPKSDELSLPDIKADLDKLKDIQHTSSKMHVAADTLLNDISNTVIEETYKI